MSKKKALVASAGIILILNLVPFRPVLPLVDCDSANGGPFVSFGKQFGFPFAYLQRSISPSSCTFTNPGQASTLSTHHVYVGYGVADLIIGLLILYGVARYFDHKPAAKKAAK